MKDRLDTPEIVAHRNYAADGTNAEQNYECDVQTSICGTYVVKRPVLMLYTMRVRTTDPDGNLSVELIRAGMYLLTGLADQP